MALQPMTYTLPNQSTKHKTCNYYNSCGCRFGDECWFDHSVNKSSVNHEILHQLITLNGTIIKQQTSITKMESAIENLRSKQSDEITANISDNILDKINAILHQQQSQNKINRFDNEQTNIKQQLNNLNKQMIKINQTLTGHKQLLVKEINKIDSKLTNYNNFIAKNLCNKKTINVEQKLNNIELNLNHINQVIDDSVLITNISNKIKKEMEYNELNENNYNNCINTANKQKLEYNELNNKYIQLKKHYDYISNKSNFDYIQNKLEELIEININKCGSTFEDTIGIMDDYNKLDNISRSIEEERDSYYKQLVDIEQILNTKNLKLKQLKDEIYNCLYENNCDLTIISNDFIKIKTNINVIQSSELITVLIEGDTTKDTIYIPKLSGNLMKVFIGYMEKMYNCLINDMERCEDGLYVWELEFLNHVYETNQMDLTIHVAKYLGIDTLLQSIKNWMDTYSDGFDIM